MIHLQHLVKRFGDEEEGVLALDGVDLRIARGEIFGIIGLSGAGKSTLVRCINLLERPTSGSVRIDGRDVTLLRGRDLRRLRSGIGMIFQHFNLLMQRTVAGNIAFPLEVAGFSRRRIRERTDELLALVGLEDKRDAWPAQLSGGQKQRVAIARALANEPKILLCDEATSALDPITTGSILSLLEDINRRFGITIVVITHEMDVIRRVCDRVAVLDRSRAVEIGPVRDVLTSPKSEAARLLLGYDASAEGVRSCS